MQYAELLLKVGTFKELQREKIYRQGLADLPPDLG